MQTFIGELKQLEHKLEQGIEELKSRYGKRFRRKQRVKQVFYVIINNQKYIPMGNQVLTLPQAGQPQVAYPINDALVDAGTLQPIPGATPTPVSRKTDNPAVAVIDSNGNLLPLTAGTFNLIDENTWNYTDEDTNQPVTGKDEVSTTPFSVVSGPEQVLQQTTLGAPVAAGTVPGATPPVTPPTT